MSFSVLLHPKAVKFLEKLDRINSDKIKSSLKKLENNTSIKESPSNLYRIRADDYRAIYEIDEKGKRIIVLFIGHRKNVYDDFSKLL